MAQVQKLAAEYSAQTVTKVKVLIGPFSGVVIDSFIFAFDAIKEKVPLMKKSSLEIQCPRPVLKCRNCGEEIVQQKQGDDNDEFVSFSQFYITNAKCPYCGLDEAFLAGGDEILLLQVEME